MREHTAEQQARENDDHHQRNDRESSAFVFLVASTAARRVAHLLGICTLRRQAAPREMQKDGGVIRVRIPLDLEAVAHGGATVFSFATPLRVRELLALAVREAIGELAPADKFSRSMHRTLSGLCEGDYTLNIDGRTFADPDAVVVCGSTADVRFYVKNRRERVRPAR